MVNKKISFLVIGIIVILIAGFIFLRNTQQAEIADLDYDKYKDIEPPISESTKELIKADTGGIIKIDNLELTFAPGAINKDAEIEVQLFELDESAAFYKIHKAFKILTEDKNVILVNASYKLELLTAPIKDEKALGIYIMAYPGEFIVPDQENDATPIPTYIFIDYSKTDSSGKLASGQIFFLNTRYVIREN